MLITIAIALLIFCIGAALGSFLSVVMYRLHHEEAGILRGRSRCTLCKTELKPLDLIPLVSFLTLRGKCRYCDREISYMYPLIELFTGVLLVLFFLKFPFVDEALQFHEGMFGLFLLYAFYTCVLVFTFFYDLHYMHVADEALLPGIIIGLIVTLATPATPHFFDAILGAAIALGFFGLQIFISKGTWLGEGDLRVGAFMGIILGWQLTIVALVISYFLGSIVSLFIVIQKKKIRGLKIPFAPLLVTGTLVTIFFGSNILQWYLNHLGLV